MRIGDLIGNRWVVRAPYSHANCRNFSFFIVEDSAVADRDALLKVVRKTDLPSEALHARRVAAFNAEIDRVGSLVMPHFAEPLDIVSDQSGESCVVYALLDEAGGTFTFRELIQRWGFIHKDGETICREMPRIAEYMGTLASLTEELWKCGYVHGNLSPDHVLSLKDNLVRLVGMSGLCKHSEGFISNSDPGLFNMTIGYQSPRHRGCVSGDIGEPVPGMHVRWYTYAALALDLIWGRDIRDYCQFHGTPSIEWNDTLENTLWRDFESFVEVGFRSRQDPRLSDLLSELYDLLRKCLGGPVVDNHGDTLERFEVCWAGLRNHEPGYEHRLTVSPDEMSWRKRKGWRYRKYVVPLDKKTREPAAWDEQNNWDSRRRKEGVPWEIGNESVFLVCSGEEVQEKVNDEGEKRTFYLNEVVDMRFPAKRRFDSDRRLVATMRTTPRHHAFLLPGDIVAGQYVRSRKFRGPVVFLPEWAAGGDVTPPEGENLRALSLGRLERAGPGIPAYEVPWALVDCGGRILAYRVINASPQQKFAVFPEEGCFFNAQFVERESESGFRETGVVFAERVALQELMGHRADAMVQHVSSNDNVFFDVPFEMDGKKLIVTCVLPLSQCGEQNICCGQEVPIRVVEVNENRIKVVWDSGRSGQRPIVGKSYMARFLHRSGKRAYFRFGEGDVFSGSIDLDLSSTSIPWGLPFRQWESGTRIAVKVRRMPGASEGSLEYELIYAGRTSDRCVSDVFQPGCVFRGRVIKRFEHGALLVVIIDGVGADCLEVVGMIPKWLLDRGNLEEQFAPKATLAVRIQKLELEKRHITLAPHDGQIR